MAGQKFSQPCHHIANSVPNYSFVIPLFLVLYKFLDQKYVDQYYNLINLLYLLRKMNALISLNQEHQQLQDHPKLSLNDTIYHQLKHSSIRDGY